jgi:hypothetical protein
MKHYHQIGRVISASAFILAFMLYATTSKSQTMSIHGSRGTQCTIGNYYVKIFGIAGPAKGYYHKGIASSGVNGVEVPDRLKAGTYAIRIVGAGGNIIPEMNGAAVTVTSKPQDTASSMISGKRIHKPFAVTRSIDSTAPVTFDISAADVDDDGRLLVSIAVGNAGSSVTPAKKD